MTLKPVEWVQQPDMISAFPFNDTNDIELRIYLDHDLDGYAWSVFFGDSAMACGDGVGIIDCQAMAIDAYKNLLLSQFKE